MNVLKGSCIIGQSGGPTSVINASAYGVIDTALKSGVITRVLGAEHGIKGVLNDRLFDMGLEDPEELRLLNTPPPLPLDPAATSWLIPPWTTRITRRFWRSSRSMMSGISFITVVTTPWIPAIRSTSICSLWAMSAV